MPQDAHNLGAPGGAAPQPGPGPTVQPGNQPIYIFNGGGPWGPPPPQPPPPPRHRLGNAARGFFRKVILVACLAVAGIVALAVLGLTHPNLGGLWPGSGTPTPVVTQPVPSPSPSPTLPPVPSHQTPDIALNNVMYGQHNPNGQDLYTDITLNSVQNVGKDQATNVTVWFEQNGKTLYVSSSPWNPANDNGQEFPGTLASGASTTPYQTFTITNFAVGPPIDIVVGANGVPNSPTMAKVSCPTTVTNVDNRPCQVIGGS